MSDDLYSLLPRSKPMDGTDLNIRKVAGPEVLISDGTREAYYVPYEGEPLEGELSIVPTDVEAGWYSEANVVVLTYGTRQQRYIPVWRPEILEESPSVPLAEE